MRHKMRKRFFRNSSFCLFVFLFFCASALAGAEYFASDKGILSLWWCLPFGLVLCSLAFFPLILPKIWHLHYGKIVSFYTLGILLPLLSLKGGYDTLCMVAEILVHHYCPFLLLITALYITAGGIEINIRASPSAKLNTLILGIATFVAGWIGTTGAAMLFIRPFLMLNKDRFDRQHLVIFFIILVGNIGGGLTPLGDPPLFLGYLEGVDFFWPLKTLALPILFLTVPLLVIFYLWDRRHQEPLANMKEISLKIQGYENIAYIGAIIFLILITSLWKSKMSLNFLGTSWSLENFIRDAGLALIAMMSYFKTNPLPRKSNNFSWSPLQEVAILFAAIFITVAPVIEILKTGERGPLQQWLGLVHNGEGAPSAPLYFWATGILSSFLDNAPTYLVFFNMAGGNAALLMTTLEPILGAISAGAVFMGALTYIGNAPNFMIKAIAESHGIGMPSFCGYTLRVFLLLAPLFGILTLLFFK